MEIILTQDVEYVGYKDDIVTVKDGYGRNFLIPKGFGIIATNGIKKGHLEILEQRAFKEKKIIEDAKNQADTLKTLKIKILAKVAEGGTKLFGSITSASISDALGKEGLEIKKKYISLPGRSIKTLGRNTAKIRLHREVEVDIQFEVLPTEKQKKTKRKAITPKKEEEFVEETSNNTGAKMNQEESIKEIKEESENPKVENDNSIEEIEKEAKKSKAEEKKSIEEVAEEAKKSISRKK